MDTVAKAIGYCLLGYISYKTTSWYIGARPDFQASKGQRVYTNGPVTIERNERGRVVSYKREGSILIERPDWFSFRIETHKIQRG